MYGFHDRETAIALAKQKTSETGTEHHVVPAEWSDGPAGKFTLAVKIKAMSGKDFLDAMKQKLANKKDS